RGRHHHRHRGQRQRREQNHLLGPRGLAASLGRAVGPALAQGSPLNGNGTKPCKSPTVWFATWCRRCWPRCAAARRRRPTGATARSASGRKGRAGGRGVFADVSAGVGAAAEAKKEFERRGLNDRRKAVDCIRRICRDRAEELGRDELEETKIGRLPHKVEKL